MVRKPELLNAKTAHTATVLLLHGLGDSGAGLLDVARYLSSKPSLSHIRWILPSAPAIPITLNMGARMPGWFDIRSLTGLGGTEDLPGFMKSRDSVVRELIDREVRGGQPVGEVGSGPGLSSTRIVVGGFSQGGALGLFSALTSPIPLGGSFALSAWLPLHQDMPSMMTAHTASLPLFFGHGDQDQTVQYDFGKRSVQWLQDQASYRLLPLSSTESEGVKPGRKSVVFETYQGMEHSLCQAELEHLGNWLQAVLPKN